MAWRRFDDLPFAARALGSKLVDVCPELKDTLANLYPNDLRDRRIRAQREAVERASQEAARTRREDIARRALAGEFGRQAQAAASAAFQQCGSELTPTAVQRINDIVRAAEKARTRTKRKRPHV